MKIVKASANILASTPNLEEVIETAGRVCWKSEDKVCPGSASPFIERLKNLKHESVLEHGSITVRFIIDRGISHELVRHRIASFSQESTRYCNYGKGKFGNEITVIDLRGGFPEMTDEAYLTWKHTMAAIETNYLYMLTHGSTPQEARSILPNSLKTEVVMTTNPREWRHVFKLRCHHTAHPQIREVMIPLWHEFANTWPVLFSDARFIDTGTKE